MELNTSDSALKSTLEKALGHLAPFTEQELHSLISLKINYAKDVSLIRHCINLQNLEIFACDLQDLDILKTCKKLSNLRVACSPLKNIQYLRDFSKLETVELVLTFVEDLAPLMDLPMLTQGVLLGNPWTPESYQELKQKLLTIPTANLNKPPLIDFSSEKEWQFTRNLYSQGLPASFAKFDTRPVLVKPGIPSIPNSICDFLNLPMAFIEMEIRTPDFTLEKIFNKYLGTRDTNSNFRKFDFYSHYLIGSGDDAQKWVTCSSLLNDTKQSLLHFIGRFEELIFYREDNVLLNREEESANITLPQWLRDIRQTLAFVLPHNLVEIQFDNFDRWSVQMEKLDRIWYTFGLLGASDSEQRVIINGDRVLFPISEWVQTGYSTLAINIADPDDRQVYEYNQEDIRTGGKLTEKAAKVVFNSYASLLQHIVRIRLENGNVIEGV